MQNWELISGALVEWLYQTLDKSAYIYSLTY